MEEIVWEDRYYIGIVEVDKQHFDFIKLLNRIIILSKSSGHIKLLDRILLEMIKYAEYHVISEENMMIIYRYPSLGDQKKEHRILLKNLHDKYADVISSNLNINDLIKYLAKWFIEHTQNADRKFAKYIQETKSAPNT